jgi:hypothetical protein
MKAYVIVTGTAFGLLAIAHVWRAIVEPSARHPGFILLTVLCVALCGWAFTLLRRPATSAASSSP